MAGLTFMERAQVPGLTPMEQAQIEQQQLEQAQGLTPVDAYATEQQQAHSFGRGLRSGMFGMKAGMQGFAGSLLDAAGASEMARSVYDAARANEAQAAAWQPQVHSYKQVVEDPSLIGSYIAGHAGGFAPYVPLGIGGAAVGRAVAGTAGSTLGGMAAFHPVTAGAIANQLYAEKPQMTPGERLAESTLYGGAEALAGGAVPAALTGRMVTRAAPARSVIGALARGTGEVAGTSAAGGAGMAAMEGLEQHRKGHYDPEALKEAFWGGAAGMAPMAVPHVAGNMMLDSSYAGGKAAADAAKNVAEEVGKNKLVQNVQGEVTAAAQNGYDSLKNYVERNKDTLKAIRNGAEVFGDAMWDQIKKIASSGSTTEALAHFKATADRAEAVGEVTKAYIGEKAAAEVKKNSDHTEIGKVADWLLNEGIDKKAADKYQNEYNEVQKDQVTPSTRNVARREAAVNALEAYLEEHGSKLNESGRKAVQDVIDLAKSGQDLDQLTAVKLRMGMQGVRRGLNLSNAFERLSKFGDDYSAPTEADRGKYNKQNVKDAGYAAAERAGAEYANDPEVLSALRALGYEGEKLSAMAGHIGEMTALKMNTQNASQRRIRDSARQVLRNLGFGSQGRMDNPVLAKLVDTMRKHLDPVIERRKAEAELEGTPELSDQFQQHVADAFSTAFRKVKETKTWSDEQHSQGIEAAIEFIKKLANNAEYKENGKTFKYADRSLAFAQNFSKAMGEPGREALNHILEASAMEFRDRPDAFNRVYRMVEDSRDIFAIADELAKHINTDRVGADSVRSAAKLTEELTKALNQTEGGNLRDADARMSSRLESLANLHQRLTEKEQALREEIKVNEDRLRDHGLSVSPDKRDQWERTVRADYDRVADIRGELASIKDQLAHERLTARSALDNILTDWARKGILKSTKKTGDGGSKPDINKIVDLLFSMQRAREEAFKEGQGRSYGEKNEHTNLPSADDEGVMQGQGEDFDNSREVRESNEKNQDTVRKITYHGSETLEPNRASGKRKFGAPVTDSPTILHPFGESSGYDGVRQNMREHYGHRLATGDRVYVRDWAKEMAGDNEGLFEEMLSRARDAIIAKDAKDLPKIKAAIKQAEREYDLMSKAGKGQSSEADALLQQIRLGTENLKQIDARLEAKANTETGNDFFAEGSYNSRYHFYRTEQSDAANLDLGVENLKYYTPRYTKYGTRESKEQMVSRIGKKDGANAFPKDVYDRSIVNVRLDKTHDNEILPVDLAGLVSSVMHGSDRHQKGDLSSPTSYGAKEILEVVHEVLGAIMTGEGIQQSKGVRPFGSQVSGDRIVYRSAGIGRDRKAFTYAELQRMVGNSMYEPTRGKFTKDQIKSVVTEGGTPKEFEFANALVDSNGKSFNLNANAMLREMMVRNNMDAHGLLLHGDLPTNLVARLMYEGISELVADHGFLAPILDIGKGSRDATRFDSVAVFQKKYGKDQSFPVKWGKIREEITRQVREKDSVPKDLASARELESTRVQAELQDEVNSLLSEIQAKILRATDSNGKFVEGAIEPGSFRALMSHLHDVQNKLEREAIAEEVSKHGETDSQISGRMSIVQKKNKQGELTGSLGVKGAVERVRQRSTGNEEDLFRDVEPSQTGQLEETLFDRGAALNSGDSSRYEGHRGVIKQAYGESAGVTRNVKTDSSDPRRPDTWNKSVVQSVRPEEKSVALEKQRDLQAVIALIQKLDAAEKPHPKIMEALQAKMAELAGRHQNLMMETGVINKIDKPVEYTRGEGDSMDHTKWVEGMRTIEGKLKDEKAKLKAEKPLTSSKKLEARIRDYTADMEAAPMEMRAPIQKVIDLYSKQLELAKKLDALKGDSSNGAKLERARIKQEIGKLEGKDVAKIDEALAQIEKKLVDISAPRQKIGDGERLWQEVANASQFHVFDEKPYVETRNMEAVRNDTPQVSATKGMKGTITAEKQPELPTPVRGTKSEAQMVKESMTPSEAKPVGEKHPLEGAAAAEGPKAKRDVEPAKAPATDVLTIDSMQALAEHLNSAPYEFSTNKKLMDKLSHEQKQELQRELTKLGGIDDTSWAGKIYKGLPLTYGDKVSNYVMEKNGIQTKVTAARDVLKYSTTEFVDGVVNDQIKPAEVREYMGRLPESDRQKIYEQVEQLGSKEMVDSMRGMFKRADGEAFNKQTPVSDLSDANTLKDREQWVANETKRLVGSIMTAAGKLSVKDAEGAEVLAKYESATKDAVANLLVNITDSRYKQGTHHEIWHGVEDVLKAMGSDGEHVLQTVHDAMSTTAMKEWLNAQLAKESEGAKAQLMDASERAAYGFQFFMRDKGLPLRPELNGLRRLWRDIKEWVMDKLGITTKEQRAENFFKYLDEGGFLRDKDNAKAMVNALQELNGDRAVAKVLQVLKPAKELFGKVFTAGVNRVRDHEIKEFNEITELYAGKDGKGGFIGDRNRFANVFGNKLEDILAATDWDTLDNANQWARVMPVLSELRKYMEGRGIADEKINNLFNSIEKGGFSFDAEKVSSRMEEFMADLVQHGGLTKAQLNSGEARNIATRIAERGYYFNPELRLFSGEGGGVYLNKWRNNDVKSVAAAYIMQGVKMAERQKWFGERTKDAPMGVNVKRLLDAVEGTASAQAKADMRDFMDGFDGRTDMSMSPEMKKAVGMLLMVQNVHLLPLAVFAQMMEPMQLALRKNSFDGSLDAMWRGIKDMPRVFETYNKNYGKDYWENLSRQIGTSTPRIYGNMMSHLSNGIASRGIAGWVNDQFFKWNLMEGWQRSMHIEATKHAVEFMIDHANGIDKKHSARFLSELGLTKEDVLGAVTKNERGERTLDLTGANGDKLSKAIHQWVDEAMAHPDVGSNPFWMNDPRFALIAQMKRFTFGFSRYVLDRADREMLQHENYMPAIIMAGMLPWSMAIGAVRPGTPLPDNLIDMLTQSFQRTGLGGKSDFLTQAFKAESMGGNAVESALGPTATSFGSIVRSMRQGTFDLNPF